MYRVLIVDDEEPVLDGYAFMLENSGREFSLAGKARSGYEAIRAIRELRPDVVFMDINIPDMDGIQVIAELHSSFPNTVFILSTAYERFDLAQKAIPLGIFAYLVKPVSKTTFLETLDSVRSVLQKRKPEPSTGGDEALRRFLLETLWTEIREDEWVCFRERFSFHSDKGIVLLIDFTEKPGDSHAGFVPRSLLRAEAANGEAGNSFDESRGTNPAYNPSLAEPAYPAACCGVVDWCRDIAARISFRHRCLYSQRSNRGIFLVPEDADRDTLHEFVSGIIGASVPEGTVHAFALGNAHRGPELYLSCEEALEELRKKERNADERLRERLRISQIRRKIGILDIAEVRSVFDSLWKDLFAVYEFPTAKAKLAAFFVLLLDDFAGSYGGHTEEYPLFDPAEEIMPLKDLSEWTAWGSQAIGKLHKLFESRRSRQFPVPLVKAMDFIGEHYADRLQLSSAADAAQVSAAYLSRLFSEHLRTTFIDYLTELRVGNAERLIRESRMNMKEVSFAVGYQDPNYFGKIFRKATGLSPTAYAAENRAGAEAPSEEEGI